MRTKGRVADARDKGGPAVSAELSFLKSRQINLMTLTAMNSCYNVSPTTKHILQEEFTRAAEICKGIRAKMEM